MSDDKLLLRKKPDGTFETIAELQSLTMPNLKQTPPDTAYIYLPIKLSEDGLAILVTVKPEERVKLTLPNGSVIHMVVERVEGA